MKIKQKIKCLGTLILGLSVLASCGGSSNTIDDPLLRVADDVVSETLFVLPKTKEDPQPTRYNLWMYQNYMLMEAMDALGELTGEERYKTYTGRSLDLFANYQATYGDTMTAGPAGIKHWYSQPYEMWQSGMIAAFAERQQTSPHPEFERGMAIFDALLARTPSFEDGVLVRNKNERSITGLGLQIDDLYMIVPYWARKSQLTKDPSHLDRAIDESLHYFDYLWNEQDQLMKSLWLEEKQGTFGLYWGRGNGWYILAMSDLLTFVPENHPKREELLQDYRAFIAGITQRQGKNGLWHQIIDRPDTYEETSSSGMFTYTILKGVNEGWLDESYRDVGNKGWQGLLTMVDEDYKILNVCPPSDISEDPEYYLNGRAPRVHDQHGIGPFILAGVEYRKANVAH